MPSLPSFNFRYKLKSLIPPSDIIARISSCQPKSRMLIIVINVAGVSIVILRVVCLESRRWQLSSATCYKVVYPLLTVPPWFVWIKLNVHPRCHPGIWKWDNYENQHVVRDNSHLWSCYGLCVLCIRYWLIFIMSIYVCSPTFRQPENNSVDMSTLFFAVWCQSDKNWDVWFDWSSLLTITVPLM